MQKEDVMAGVKRRAAMEERERRRKGRRGRMGARSSNTERIKGFAIPHRQHT